MVEKRKSKERKTSDKSTGEVQIKANKTLDKKKHKLALKKKTKRENGNAISPINDDQLSHKGGQAQEKDPKHTKTTEKSSRKSGLRKKSRREKGSEVDSSTGDQLSNEDNHTVNGLKKIKKDRSHKKKDLQSATEWKKGERLSEVTAEKVDEISSVDEDCSRGMKKWLSKYKDSRPGLKILEERIDDFITAYEEQQEQERKEREALAAEGGWTVVVHQKGRKKTTDTESGITVGSVAPAAVVDKMSKKKNKDVPLDFYRFQKREAKRKEVMMLQSKFEQDKKRIQELRAARKFRPY